MNAGDLKQMVQDLAGRIREGGEIWRTMERLAEDLPGEVWNDTTEKEAGAACLALTTTTAIRRLLWPFNEIGNAANVEDLIELAQGVADALQAALAAFDAATGDGKYAVETLGLAEALERVGAKPEPAAAGA